MVSEILSFIGILAIVAGATWITIIAISWIADINRRISLAEAQLESNSNTISKCYTWFDKQADRIDALEAKKKGGGK